MSLAAVVTGCVFFLRVCSGHQMYPADWLGQLARRSRPINCSVPLEVQPPVRVIKLLNLISKVIQLRLIKYADKNMCQVSMEDVLLLLVKLYHAKQIMF